MSHPQTANEEFISGWNKAAAWAQTQGIPTSDYLPVYQLDVRRMGEGYSAMSAGERNRAILAAANPNNVTPAPTDNPQPSNVFVNARNDLASIVTGLEPNHLISGLFDTVKNTVQAIEDPKKLEGKNAEDTAANWLQNTLLSFIPGAYDVGAYIRADPNLTGLAGFKALADHPLLSLMDVMPADATATRVLADTAVGERLAAAGGQTTAQLGEHGVGSALVKVLTNRKAGMGIKPYSAAEGITQLTVGDRLQSWLQDSKLGTSAPVQHIVKEWMVGNQLGTGLYQSMMTPFLDTFKSLDDNEKARFQEISLEQQKGANIEEMLRDPKTTPKVRAAWQEFEPILQFEREEALVGHGGEDPDVTAVRYSDGTIHLYSSKQADSVITARDTLRMARADFMEHHMDPADALAKTISTTDAKIGQVADGLGALRQRAENAIPENEALLENVNVDYTPAGKTKPIKLPRGVKRQNAEKVFGPSGYVDQLVQALKKGDMEQAEGIAEVVRSRTSKWDAYSVNAEDMPQFRAVADMVDQVEQIIQTRNKANDELDRRIEGESTATTQERKDDARRRADEQKQLQQRQAAANREVRNQVKAATERINSARRIKLENLDQLYEQMKDAALTRGDNAAVRATKEQADAIYRQVKTEIGQLRNEWFRSKNEANVKYDKEVSEVKLTAERLKGQLKKKHDAERADQAKDFTFRKDQNGVLTRELRGYLQVVKDFHQAVYDHPSDEYVSAEVELYMKGLERHAINAQLIDEYDKTLREKSGFDQSRIDALHENTDLMREQIYLLARDVYDNPLSYQTALADAVKQAMDEVKKSGLDELHTLIAQGFKPMWIPKVDSSTYIPSAIKALVGKGTPHVDVAMARIHDLTATRHDAVAGVTKAMAQTILRDATIDMVEHSIVPRTITGAELIDQVRGLPGFEHLDTSDANSLDHYAAQLKKAGLRRVDPQKLFGFTFPRWQDEALYMPEGLARALERMQELQSTGDKGLFDKTNQVFRYSILGLSPRYTAHILFGGTFLLALRSTPYMPSLILRAARMMKNGEIPERVWRQTTQEGFGRMQLALQEHAWAGGEQLSKIAVQEHIEKVQGVLLSKASPFHYLKAAADLNFRFTRYATRMQTAIAYLDYMSRAERKTHFVDDLTGQLVPMTKERAIVEAMDHVQAVFGDLRSMSPLERSVAKNIMPFYGWTRHILKYVLTMPVDHPWRAMILALTAYENSADVPKGLPQRIQFLFFLGSPDSQGNVSAIDTRFMDPLRDVANYASLGGWIQGLNPVFLGPAAMLDPELVYGSTSLYPNLTYNDMYGIETAGAQGSAVTGLEQFIPQLGAVQPLTAALTKAGNVRELSSNPNAFYKSIFEDLNIPFAQVQKVNVKQMAAKDEIARYEVAKQASLTAFQTGDFSGLAGYSSVPNPLNPDYEISVDQLKEVYNQALANYPGQQPINVLLPPPTPSGY